MLAGVGINGAWIVSGAAVFGVLSGLERTGKISTQRFENLLVRVGVPVMLGAIVAAGIGVNMILKSNEERRANNL